MVQRDFYPRSPCGERHVPRGCCVTIAVFLSTLSLRRATNVRQVFRNALNISIHALLAESDRRATGTAGSLAISIHALLAESDSGCLLTMDTPNIFLSTLSLRRATFCLVCFAITRQTRFLSTLSLRRATLPAVPVARRTYFYPRSPCGERLPLPSQLVSCCTNFYPRSPCGERRLSWRGRARESYFYPRSPCGERPA